MRSLHEASVPWKLLRLTEAVHLGSEDELRGVGLGDPLHEAQFRRLKPCPRYSCATASGRGSPKPTTPNPSTATRFRARVTKPTTPSPVPSHHAAHPASSPPRA